MQNSTAALEKYIRILRNYKKILKVTTSSPTKNFITMDVTHHPLNV